MKYAIFKGGAIFWSCKQPISLTREAAEEERSRLEQLRSEHNIKCDESRLTPHFRGKSFMFVRDNDPYEIKEIP